MDAVIICSLILIVFLVVWMIVKQSKKSKNCTKRKTTGCGSGLSCQHMDLGKAAKAGYGKETTFCKRYNSFMKRRDNCPEFYPHGCANGICDHSDHLEGFVYCKYYHTCVQPKESCPNYLDYFDTKAGKALAKSLK